MFIILERTLFLNMAFKHMEFSKIYNLVATQQLRTD